MASTDDIDQRIAHLEQQDQQLTRAIELLAQHATPPTARVGKNRDGYAAVIASFIGILALAVSGYTAYVQRQQLRAQIWPHLALPYSSVERTFFVTNQGTGPARVTAVRVIMNGAPAKNWDDVQKKAGFTAEEGLIRSGLNRRVLSPGKDVIIIKPNEREASQTKFEELLPGHKHAISIAVCYCSVLDECWTTGIDAIADREWIPRACPIPASERFEE